MGNKREELDAITIGEIRSNLLRAINEQSEQLRVAIKELRFSDAKEILNAEIERLSLKLQALDDFAMPIWISRPPIK